MKPNSAELNSNLIAMANFYGSIISTPNIEPKIVDKCQKNLARIVDSLDRATNFLIETNSGLAI